MEVGQDPNLGCSAKGEKKSDIKFNENIFSSFPVVTYGQREGQI
jgi:hypothetical protein